MTAEAALLDFASIVEAQARAAVQAELALAGSLRPLRGTERAPAWVTAASAFRRPRVAPWPANRPLPPLALERYPLTRIILEMIRGWPKPGPTMIELTEAMLMPRTPVKLSLEALADAKLVRRGSSRRHEHSRWIVRAVAYPDEALHRATITAEARVLALAAAAPQPQPEPEPETEPEEQIPEIEDLWVPPPGTLGPCTYDQSLDGRLERAVALAFEWPESERRPVEVGMKWRVRR